MKNHETTSDLSAIRAHPRRRIAFVLCGLAVGVVLLAVVYSLEADREGAARSERDLPELSETEPGPPEGVGQARPIPGGGDARIGPVQRGQVEIADPATGHIAQRYRFERLDPNPDGRGPGWIRLTRPVFDIFGEHGQIVRLSGDTALAYQPNTAIESGTLDGDVVIERFADQSAADSGRPGLIITTTSASLDNILGEVRADDRVHVETPGGEFLGRQLQVFLNDEEGIIQRLTVAEIDHVRLAHHESASPPERADSDGSDCIDSSNASDVGAAARQHGSAANRETQKQAKTQRNQIEGSAVEPDVESSPGSSAKKSDTTQFYRLTLTSDVLITQGTGAAARTVRGDELALIFTLEGGRLSGSFATGGETRFGAEWESHAAAQLSFARELMLFGLLLGQVEPTSARRIAPAPAADDTIITCRGPMTMTPVRDRRQWLRSPDDVRIELAGSPVELDDPAAESHAECDRLHYDLQTDRIDLLSDSRRLVVLTNPQLEAEGKQFWLQRRIQRGGFDGPGTARLVERADEGSAAEDPRAIRVEWSSQVDLRFAESEDNDKLGDLREVRFEGDVVVQGSRLAPSTGAASADLDESDTLRCRTLSAHLNERNGDRNLSRLIAEGDVEASDAFKTLWADRLDARFPEARPEQSAGKLDLKELVAESNVQLWLDDGQRVYADKLTVDGSTRTAVLTGEDVRLVDGATVIDRATRITIDEATGTYHLDGRGRFRRFDQPVLSSDRIRLEPQLLDHVEGRTEDLRMTWENGVAISSRSAGDDSDRLEPDAAHFRGDIQVLSRDVKLHHADEMFVQFAADDEGRSRIQRIEAKGIVFAKSLTDEGTLRCPQLNIDMTEDEDGRAVIERMTAEGGVEVADEQQIIWSDALVATFRPEAGTESGVSSSDVSRADEIGAVEALRNVQIRLADGQRVYADRVLAHPNEDEAQVFGDRVIVVGADFLLDRCTHLKLNRRSGQYEVVGAGEFRSFADAQPLATDDRPIPFEPPDENRPRTLVATWDDSALYLEGNGPTDTLELRGSVRAVSDPKPLEHDLIEAESLTIDFVRAEQRSAQALRHLTARGDARLESRTWQTPDRAGQPRVYFVAGQHIDYDPQTQEATVIGDGELLVRDEWPDSSDPSTESTVAGKGTTYFKWRRQLHMKRVVDEIFDILLTGDVECLHQNAAGRTAQFWGQSLDVQVERQTVAPVAVDPVSPEVLDLGGSMTVKRIRGEGGISIRTTDRQVACDRFEYNPITGLAEIHAAPGRTASILTTGSARTMQARHALWNMNTGAITIFSGSGSQ